MPVKHNGNYLFELIESLDEKEVSKFLKTQKKGTNTQRLFIIIKKQIDRKHNTHKTLQEKEVAEAFGKPQSYPVVKKQLEEKIEQWLIQQPAIESDTGFMNHEMALVQQLLARQLFKKAHQKLLKIIDQNANQGKWTRLASLLQYEMLFAEKFFNEKELMPEVNRICDETVISLQKATNLAEYNRLNVKTLNMMFNDSAPALHYRNQCLQMLSHPILKDEKQALSFQAKMVRLGVIQMLYKLCGENQKAINTAYQNAIVCLTEAEGKLPNYARVNGLLNFLHLSEKNTSSKEFENIVLNLNTIKLPPEQELIYELKFFAHRYFYWVTKREPKKVEALCKKTLQLITNHENSLEPLTLSIAYFYLGKWYAIEGKYNEAYNLLVHPIIAGLPQNYRSIYLSTLLWKAVVSALSKKPNFALQELNSILYQIKKDFSTAALELKICSLIILHLKKDKLNWKEIYTTLLNEHKTEIMHQQKMEYHSVNIFVFLKAIAQNKTYWQI